jgi:transcriptional regulator with PAS, ATPase and Fis domain
MGCQPPDIHEDAFRAIYDYNWPGNVRELENVLERCLNFIESGLIKVNDLPFHIRNYQVGRDMNDLELRDQIDEAERLTIINALKKCGGSKVKAANLLGISRAGIYQKIAKYSIK